jgi:YesN/AraC family two-component response regulator
MNLLIVDDEIFAIQGILDGVDWSRLEYQKVLTAPWTRPSISENAVDVCSVKLKCPMAAGLI